MKKLIKLISTVMVALLMLCLSVAPAFAAGEATVNGNTASVGSTVEYTLSIADSHQAICGIHYVIFFDTEVLELKSFNADNVGGTINDNQNGDGQIVVVNGLINGASGLACTDKTVLATATFEVIGEGDTSIEYYIPYMYDFDMVNIYDYTLTHDITVDGEDVIVDEAPALADVSTLDGFDAGDFENNPEGTGSGIKPAATQASTSSSSSDNNSGSKVDGKIVATIVIGIVLVVCIVVLLIVKSKNSKQKESAD